MKWRHSLLSRLALCTLALGGCASTGQLPGEPALPPIRAGTIARLIVDGPNAYPHIELYERTFARRPDVMVPAVETSWNSGVTSRVDDRLRYRKIS